MVSKKFYIKKKVFYFFYYLKVAIVFQFLMDIFYEEK